VEPTLIAALESALGVAVVGGRPAHGGDVAQAYQVEVADGRLVFAKTHRDPPPGFFVTEAAGLRWLAQAGAVAVPEVLAVTDGGGPGGGGPVALLALEWIEEGSPGPTTEPDLGRALAALHRAGAPCFGRVDRRSTGSRSLPNDPCDTWVEFYATRRLLPLAAMARRSQALDPGDCDRLEVVAARLGQLGGGAEPPCRLHGDLWAGNRLVDAEGRSWLIDPAAHGGHREFDLAMMQLFGGFGQVCFDAYAESFPLGDGWRERVQLHQLAPLVVHAVKFGGGYRQAVRAALDRYA
jgi:fructosamine-3-kinase